jgi:hypothetical protein
MFGWFKKKRRHEKIKLVFQNGSAATKLASLYDVTRNPAEADRMRAFEDENRRIALAPEITASDERALLDMNMELRRLFIVAEATGPEARVRQAMGVPVIQRDFDDVHKPIEGWEEYYKTW